MNVDPQAMQSSAGGVDSDYHMSSPSPSPSPPSSPVPRYKMHAFGHENSLS